MSRRTMLVTLAAVVVILLAVMLVFLANSDSGISPEDRKGTEFVEQTEGGAGEEQFPGKMKTMNLCCETIIIM